jgi:(2Fe-2S) ferredoxin
MKVSPYRPRVQLLVCTNQRADSDPLGGGCGVRGESVFNALKARARGSDIWVARTSCLGLCPKTGCTVAIAPSMQYLIEVEDSDVDAVLSAAR